MARSVLEGVAFALKYRADLIATFTPVKFVVSSGGATGSDLWNQIKADVFELEWEVIQSTDTTLVGAATVAASGAGVSFDHRGGSSTTYTPNTRNKNVYQTMYQRFLHYEQLMIS
jgi:sugar (pentulose or hexulose) kinase